MTQSDPELGDADDKAGEEPAYVVYMLACADGTLYTGIARDVAKRLAEHNGERGKGARYTAARRPVRLVYQQRVVGRSAAQREEARLKALTRADKDVLVLAYRRGLRKRQPA